MIAPTKRRPAAQVAVAKKAMKLASEAKKPKRVWSSDTPPAPRQEIEPPPSPERVRASDRSQGPPDESDLLAGYLDLEPFAKKFKRHPRSVRRWTMQPDGLPFVKIGNRVLIHVETARQWMFSRLRRPNPRREDASVE